jgi:hypothetical protein
VFTELHLYGYRSSDLVTISEKALLPTGDKLRSLAFLEDLVRDLFERQGLGFVNDRIYQCFEAQAAKDALKEQRILVIGGPERVPLYEEWIQWAVSKGAEIELVLEYIPGREDLFEGSYLAASRLETSLSGSGNRGCEKPWYGALFAGQEISAETPEICVMSMADPLAECEWVLRSCLGLFREGMWPSKIGIFIRDLETYAPLMIASSKRLGVPLSVTLHSSLLTNRFASFILKVLECFASKDVRKLLYFCENSYLYLEHDLQSEFVGAVEEAHARKRGAWEALYEWSRSNKDRYKWLFHLLEWRQNAVLEPALLSTWLERLRHLLDGTSVPENIAKEPLSMCERDLRAQSALQRSLADYASSYDMKYPGKLRFEEFVEMCQFIWGQEDMVVPASSSGVAVSSFPEGFPELDVLFVVGMLEGIIPWRRSENPILNDEDRWEIAKNAPHKPALRDSASIAREERDLFIRLCASAQRKIVFSYPQTDENRDNVPAFYLFELERKFGEKIQKRDYPRTKLVPELEECIVPGDRSLCEALEGPQVSSTPPTLISKEAKEVIQYILEKPVEPEELATVLNCPFKAVFQYRLGVNQVRRANLWHALKQIPARLNLSLISDPLVMEKKLQGEVLSELERLFPKLSSWEILLLHSWAQRLIKGWIHREIGARKLWGSREGRFLANVDLEGGELKNEVPLGGIKVRLKGKVVGLSRQGDYSIMHFFTSSAPRLDYDLESNSELFVYGLYLMTQFGRAPGLGIEIDSMSGERVLGLLPRFANADFQSQAQEGLSVKEITDRPGEFFHKVKQRMRKAVDLLQESTIEVKPGEGCVECWYGELCRSSKEFGEVEGVF